MSIGSSNDRRRSPVKFFIIDGSGWVIKQEPGKKPIEQWIQTKPEGWQEGDETKTVEIVFLKVLLLPLHHPLKELCMVFS